MKWYTYLICFVMIIIGTFSGIQLFKEIKAESYINGSIDITNKFNQESYNYSGSSVTFYHNNDDTTETYIFETATLQVDDFNGDKNKYNLVLNDYIISNAQFNSGSVLGIIDIDFHDINGEIVCSSTLTISIKFLSKETVLCLSTTGKIQADYLTQYFNDNGIRLQVIELL